MKKCLNKVVIRCNFVYHVVYILLSLLTVHGIISICQHSVFTKLYNSHIKCHYCFNFQIAKRLKCFIWMYPTSPAGALDKSKHVRFKESRVSIWSHMYPRSPAGLYTSPSCQLQRLFSLIGSVKCNTAL